MTFSEGPPDQHGDGNEIPISFEGWGIRGKASIPMKGPAEVPEPSTAREVWPLVKQQLCRIAVHFVGLPADVLGGARSIVRGLASIPQAVSRRIEGAQVQADVREDQAQAAALEAASPRQALPVSEHADPVKRRVGSERAFEIDRATLDASEELRSFLEHQRSLGKHVVVKELPGGRVAIVITHPDAGPGTEAAIDDWPPAE